MNCNGNEGLGHRETRFGGR